MDLIMRPYGGDSDLPLIADLIQVTPPACRHRVDFPWRLSSPALQSVADTCLWVSADGALLGFTAWQICWAALDFYVRPGPLQTIVEDAIFAWARERFRTLDAARGRALPYWVETREDDHERLALLARNGYMLDDDRAYVIMRRPLGEPLSLPALPAGFSIRPLAGASEVGAYVSLHQRAFARTCMTADWRARVLRMPSYQPECDLVAIAPNGQLAGFCVGWVSPIDRTGQIEPLGVDPTFQGQGLGRALIAEMLGQFKARGAEQAVVETEATHVLARRVYEAAGFRPIHIALRKGRRFSQRHAA